ncbi:MAG: phosphoglycerate dehydrogenase [Armatimonadetes bacterium]|nr:phosphoglycerate dehydrogenase [Armatimonadota bacterium]
MPYKVLVTAWTFWDHAHAQRRRLEAAGCEVVGGPVDWAMSQDELFEALKGVHGVIATGDEYSRTALSRADSLRIIARWGVGYDTVDTEAATELGIVVTNTPGYLSEAVADFTFGLILSVARRIPYLNRRMLEGVFARRESVGSNVWRKTLGIVGLGEIGKAVARRAAGFDMEILASDPRQDTEFAQKHRVRYVALDELLSRSDYVTLHCDLSQGTRGLIGDQQLRLMKPTAYLVNAARGAVLDEAALAQSLKEGRLAGAAVDAFQSEPLPADHPFLSLDNCVLTPHIASASRETLDAINDVVAESVLDVLQGRRPRYVVNPAVCEQ